MATLATLIVKLAADIGGFSAEMEKAALKAQRTAERTGRAWQRNGDQLAGIGRNMTTGLTVPIVAGAGYAISAASDLNESTNAVNVVFANSSNVIKDYGKTVAQTAGLSTAQFYQMSAQTGAFLKNVGYDLDSAATETVNLTGRAADMASIFNSDVSTALGAIQSGLKGEFNPLEQFGVKLNAAAIEAKAMEMGLAGAGGELSDQAKAQAALALIYQQTNQFAGDFVNTSSSQANQQRITTAELINQAAAIGQMLLPIGFQLISWIRDVVAWFTALDPSIQRNILIVLGLVAVLGPLLVAIGSVVSAIGVLIPIFSAIATAIGAVSAPVWITIALIAAAVTLLYFAWTNNWLGIQEKTAAALAFIQMMIGIGMQFINDLVNGRLGWLSQLWSNTLGFITTYINNAIAFWKAIVAAFHAAQQGDWYTFGAKIREAVDLMLSTLGALFLTAWENTKLIFSNMVKNIVEFFRTTDWGQVGRGIIDGIANGISNGASVIAAAAKRAASAALDAAKGFLGIRSPSTLAYDEIGVPIGEGQALGWIAGIEEAMPDVTRSIGNLFGDGVTVREVPSVFSPMPSYAGLSSVSAETGGGRPGGAPTVLVPLTYVDQSLININNEYEAKRRLRDLVDEINRENENK